MNRSIRRLPLAGAVLSLVIAVAACAQSPVPTSRPSTTTEPPATPASSPSSAVSATPSGTLACVVEPESGPVPSDRLVNIRVSSSETADRLTFVFGNPSLPGPPVPPEASMDMATPPFTQAGSGAPIEVVGAHVVQIRFSGMSLSNDIGDQTYAGPGDVRPNLAGLRHAVVYDASEGILAWYVGFDSAGCVTFANNGVEVTLTIDHS